MSGISVTLGGYPSLLRWCVYSWIYPSSLATLLQVLRYDTGSLAVLRDVSDLRSYIAQNSSYEIQKRQQIRKSLRALEGQMVLWPYEYIQVGESPAVTLAVLSTDDVARRSSIVLVFW
jgi:hypothetical protein